jgi:isopentenyldiphosphate isomerase
MEENELLDLVNETDQVIGTIWRYDYAKMVAENLGYMRAIDMFIVNSEGKLWVPKRPAHKKIAPNGLDYSAGGHVGSGETYLESALREISEELNIDLTENDLEFVDIFKSADIRYFRAVYLYQSDRAPQYNTDDFVSAEWLTPQELVDKLDAGVAAKGSIRETVVELIARKLI